MKNKLFAATLAALALYSGAAAQTVLTGQVTGNTTVTLEEDQCYILRGAYVITDGSTLNVEAAVTVLAEPDALLVIEPGATANFTGTANKPIVFTSDQGSSSAPGDWVGIRLAGDAPTNDGPIPLPNTTATAGGSNSSHSLVQIEYLKIDYAGAADDLGQEYGLSLLALGEDCAIDNVLVVNSAGSGYLLRGGAPQVKNVMNINSGVHGYHFISGNTSKVQNIADLRTDASLAILNGSASFLVWNNDLAGISFENLNVGDPYTNPILSNYTVLHSLFCDEMASNSLDGIRFEKNGRAKFRNGVIGGVGSNAAGVYINGEQCIALTASGDIVVDYTDFLGNVTDADYFFATDDWDEVPGCSDDVEQWIGKNSGGDPNCAMENNRFESSLPGYDNSICFTCPLENIIEFITLGTTPIEVADFTWVSMGDLFFDQSLEFRGAFQDDNTIYAWVNPCRQGCAEQKPNAINQVVSNKALIQAYPNPAQETVTIRTNGYTTPLTASLLDLLGRTLVQTTILGDGPTTLSLQDVPAGSYFLQLSQQGVVQEVIQITKQ